MEENKTVYNTNLELFKRWFGFDPTYFVAIEFTYIGSPFMAIEISGNLSRIQLSKLLKNRYFYNLESIAGEYSDKEFSITFKVPSKYEEELRNHMVYLNKLEKQRHEKYMLEQTSSESECETGLVIISKLERYWESNE